MVERLVYGIKIISRHSALNHHRQGYLVFGFSGIFFTIQNMILCRSCRGKQTPHVLILIGIRTAIPDYNITFSTHIYIEIIKLKNSAS